MKSEDQPLLITVGQLAKLLDRSQASIERDVKAGRLPLPIKINRSVRYSLRAIEEWIAGGGLPVAASDKPKTKDS